MEILLLIVFVSVIFLFSFRDWSKRLKELQDTKQKLQNVNDKIEANNKRIQELKRLTTR